MENFNTDSKYFQNFQENPLLNYTVEENAKNYEISAHTESWKKQEQTLFNEIKYATNYKNKEANYHPSNIFTPSRKKLNVTG